MLNYSLACHSEHSEESRFLFYKELRDPSLPSAPQG